MSDKIETLRAERRAIIEAYGDMAQYHPMHAMIGGLNPAAQRLHYVRLSIAKLEKEKRPERAILTANGSGPDWRRRGGLIYDVTYRGRHAKIGRSVGGVSMFYVVQDGNIVTDNHKSAILAARAWEKIALKQGRKPHAKHGQEGFAGGDALVMAGVVGLVLVLAYGVYRWAKPSPQHKVAGMLSAGGKRMPWPFAPGVRVAVNS